MTELSPAAQAILAAFDEHYELLGPLEGNWQKVCLAAAIGALADRLQYKGVISKDGLIAIATELENHD